MESNLIKQNAQGKSGGTLCFPEAVGQLVAAGVEYYHVDYVAMRKTFYGSEGQMVTAPIHSRSVHAL